MFGYLITGIIFIALGLSPIYTKLSLWWLFLGGIFILYGILCIIHSFSIKNCWEGLMDGKPETMELLKDRVNNLKKQNE